MSTEFEPIRKALDEEAKDATLGEVILKRIENIEKSLKWLVWQFRNLIISNYSEVLTGVRKEVYDLCDGTHTVMELASILNRHPSQVSKALKALQKAGLIKVTRDGNTKKYVRIVNVDV